MTMTRHHHASTADAILLLGPTGSGKTPLGNAMARHGLLGRRAHHLDFGQELRNAASAGRRGDEYTAEETHFIEGVLERGLLLENEHFSLAGKIIERFLRQTGFQEGDLLVLNGIPRHAGQAIDLERIASVRAIAVLDCRADVVVCRLRSNVGGDRTERDDDHEMLVERKLRTFQERTEPLIRHYADRGCRIYRLRISEATTPEHAYEELSALAAVDPPVALVAEPPQ